MITANPDPSIAQDRIRNGFPKNRNCTDVPCLIIFIIFVLCWFGVGYYALYVGDIERFLVPIDSKGRKCGVDEGVRNKPMLVIFDIKKCIGKKCDTTQVCQTKCPTSNWSFISNARSINNTYNSIICEDGIHVRDKNLTELKRLIELKACAPWYLKSTPVLGRCIPEFVPDNIPGIDMTTAELKKATLAIHSSTYIDSILNKARLTKDLILLFICCSLFICLLYISALRSIALSCVWIAIILVIGLLASLSYLFYRFYSNQKWFRHIILSSASGTAAVAIALMAMCLWKKIYTASQLITETSKTTAHMLSVVFFPVIPWLINVAIFIYSIVIVFFIMSIENRQFHVREETTDGSCECSQEVNYTVGQLCEPDMFDKYCQENNGSCFSRRCVLGDVSSPTYKYYLYGFHAFGFIWLFYFISDFTNIIITSTYVKWYWTYNKADVPFFILTKSFCRVICCHMGTVAFGAVILTICRPLRMILVVSSKMRSSNVIGAILQLIFCGRGTKYFASLVEIFMKFLTRNAYIMCAMNGKGLCTAATDAFKLLINNITLVGVLNRVTSWLLRVAKVAITSLMILFAWWYFHEFQNENNRSYWYVPVILIAVGSYLVTSIFFSIFTIGVDTLFLCVLQDCEYNDGSEAKPYYMNRNIGKLFKVY